MTAELIMEYMMDAALIILALTMVASFIRTVLGPTVTDRLLGVNMINTQVMMAMILLSLRLDETYLVDIATIYAVLGFLAVVVLTKVYLGVYLEKEAGRSAGERATEPAGEEVQ